MDNYRHALAWIIGLGITLVTAVTWAENNEYEALSYDSVAIYPVETATATVLSLKETTVSSQLTALVSSVHYQVGHVVTEGETLLSLDCEDYWLALSMAEAQKDSAAAGEKLALSQRDRSMRLLNQKLTSQQDADDREAGYLQAAANNRLSEATLKRARLDASRCDIKAPFSGVITERYAHKGQLATPGTALYKMLSPTDLEVEADVSEQDAPQISMDTGVVFEGLKNYDLKLVRTVKAIDRATRTQKFRFEFTGDKPLPGTAGKIKWQSSTPHLPARFIVSYQGIPGYFVAEDGQANFKPLPGAFPGKSQPVEAPLDSLILIPPLGDIEDGASITVKNFDARF